jgi:hypothetical protein
MVFSHGDVNVQQAYAATVGRPHKKKKPGYENRAFPGWVPDDVLLSHG